MTSIRIMGVAPSSYTRTARMTCVEKGLEHEFVGPDTELGKVHPYKKFPVLDHDGVQIYETQAICAYLDAQFDGPSLTPSKPVERARAEQAISNLNCYAYAHLVPSYIFHYAFPKGEGGAPDQEAIARDLPNVEFDLGLLDREIGNASWIAGETFSTADLMWAPLVASVSKLPEGGKIVDRLANVRRWLTKVEARKSAEFLYPPAR